MTLDLSSLKKSILSLERALVFSKTLPVQYPTMTSLEIELLSAGVIQNFEFTYELCWKFMKRWLENNASQVLSTNVSRKQLFRHAGEFGLIRDFEVWTKFHEMRNQTSHTYDVEVSNEILTYTESFLQEAQFLLSALEQKND
ncbi:MAG: nucleotidyltransferase substrate binding protein [Bdellovibrionota bacterium]